MKKTLFVYSPSQSYSLFSRDEFVTDDPGACISSYLDELDDLDEVELSKLREFLMAGFREFQPTQDDIKLAVRCGLMTPAQALRAIPSEARAQASRDNGKAPVKPGSRPRGRPRKIK